MTYLGVDFRIYKLIVPPKRSQFIENKKHTNSMTPQTYRWDPAGKILILREHYLRKTYEKFIQSGCRNSLWSDASGMYRSRQLHHSPCISYHAIRNRGLPVVQNRFCALGWGNLSSPPHVNQYWGCNLWKQRALDNRKSKIRIILECCQNKPIIASTVDNTVRPSHIVSTAIRPVWKRQIIAERQLRCI